MRSLIALLALALLVAACSTTPPREDRMSQTPSTAPAPDEALRFGGISLPPSGEVFQVRQDRGIDQRYRLVVGVAAEEVPDLLSGSGFTAALAPDAGPFQDTIEGFDLTAAKSVKSVEDSKQVDGRTVFRHVAVDESDPATSVVHMWLFTT